jgi:hypothetical protein
VLVLDIVHGVVHELDIGNEYEHEHQNENGLKRDATPA